MASISSVLLKPAETIRSTNAPEIATSAEPSSFLAEIRTRGSTIPLDFFTPVEETFLKELFATYRLTSKMDPVDFIGFCCYAELENLMEVVGKLSPKQKACANAENPTFIFCSNFMYFYLRLLRNCSKYKLNSSLKTINKYSRSETEFIAILSSVLQNGNSKLKQAWGKAITSSTEKEKMMVLYKQGLQHLSHLQSLIPLFSKIFSSPYCNDLLMDHNLGCFPGSDKLDQITLKDASSLLSEIPAVRDLQNFSKFIKLCLDSAREMHWIGFYSPSFSNHLELLEIHRQKTPSTELIKSWNMIFFACMEELISMGEQCRKSYFRAKENKLNHKTWLQENNIEARRQKTQEEFLEALLLSRLQVILIECLEDDLNRMIEHHLFTPLFSKVYRSQDQMMEHFLKTLLLPIDLAYMPLVPVKSTPLALVPLFSSFYNEINKCLEPLNQFLQTSTIIDDRKALIAWHRTAGKLPFTDFSQFAAKLIPGCRLTNSILKQLPHLQNKFAQELLGFLKNTPLAELQREKTNWLSFMLEEYHSQAMRIFYQTTYFKDLEFLAAKSTFLKDWDYTVPAELRNYIIFQTEIESIFEQAENFLKSQEPVTVPVSEQTLAIPSSVESSATIVTQTGSSTPEPIPSVIDSRISPPLEKPPTERASSPVVEDPMMEKVEALLPFKIWVKTAKAPKTSSAQTKIEDSKSPSSKNQKEIMQRLKKAIKVREFEEILKERDYYFLRHGKGSHNIWRNDAKGYHVSLPSTPNTEISPGVRQLIARQVFDL